MDRECACSSILFAWFAATSQTALLLLMKSTHCCRVLDRKTLCEVSVRSITIQWEQPMRANTVECDSVFENKNNNLHKSNYGFVQFFFERVSLVRILLHSSQSHQIVKKREKNYSISNYSFACPIRTSQNGFAPFLCMSDFTTAKYVIRVHIPKTATSEFEIVAASQLKLMIFTVRCTLYVLVVSF